MHYLLYPIRKTRRILLLVLILATSMQGILAQQLKIKDFAVWGGSAPANVYNSKQGVVILGNTKVTGNVGTNHLIDVRKDFTVKGNLISGNGILFNGKNTITGNLTANRLSSAYTDPPIYSLNKSDFIGNLTANGKINIKTNSGSAASTVTGKVSVPAPSSTNYSGPTPTQGINNTVTLPGLPPMPANTNFDNSTGGTTDVVATTVLQPGIYRNLALKGNSTVTFSGPGNYVFIAVNNTGSNNKIIFDLKNTVAGLINVFVIGEANFGDVTSQLVNGNFPQRVYTEVHSKGSAATANAFTISGVSPSWIGTVWAPFRNIALLGSTNTINGALWSGTGVTLSNETTITYTAPTVVEINVINPYYPPPLTGKVDVPNNKIGSELFSLATNAPLVSIIPDNTTFRIQGDKVFIEVIGNNENDVNLKNELIALGMTGIVNNGPYTKIISGYFPISLLTALNTKANIRYVRPMYPPLTNAGQATTQGDTAMRSDKVRGRFAVDGEGVKVGVLSDSYNNRGGAAADVTEGDLPNDVQVTLDFTGNDEGRAMLQIVHDIAPKAKLAFRTGFQTAGDFAQGIADLSSASLPGGKCDVIVDDITYITEPFLRDGKVAEAVNNAVSAGVTYFSSAGNFGNRSYESAFQDAGPNPAIIPAPATLHRFGATNADTYQTLKLNPGSYTIVLQWSDEFFSQLSTTTGVQTDLDLYLVGTSGYTLFGFNRSNIFGDPFEVCPFIVTDTTEARLIVVKAGGTATNVFFKYMILRGDGTIFNYQNANPSTIVGHPNADSCIAVGAMLYGNIPPFTPIYPGVASFSSRGGSATLVRGSSTQYTPRLKPNLVAPNGVNTTVFLSPQPTGFTDGDDYPNFFGTSAAAPHAAGVAALLIHARKKFDLQTNVSPFDIRTLLQNTAGKFSGLSATHNFVGGNGFVRADSAIKGIANARPIIKNWEPDAAALIPNGKDPFAVKVNGAYLTNTTQIYFNGQALTNTVVSADKTVARGMIPAFSNNLDPAIQLYNPAKTVSGLDGGLSEDIHFFTTRKEVEVRAINQTKKYGQANPTLTFQILINGVPIDQTTTTAASLKLDGTNLTMSTNATATSPVGLYGIIPGRTTPLDNTNAVDAAIIANYNFTFTQATLAVGKMNLKITPNSKTIKYGDYIGEVTYNYELDNTQPGIPTLLEDIKALHEKYIADNALAVIHGFSSAQIPDLANMSTMASFQSVNNARKFGINNGQLRPLVNVADDEFADQRFLVDVSAQSLINYKTNPAQAPLIAFDGIDGDKRGVLNVKSLANGDAQASLNGQLKPIVNGQLLAMVNGQLKALVNGQLKALVNGTYVDAVDYVFENGQLKALVNGEWISITNGQLKAIVNGIEYTTELSVTNGQLRAIVNGIEMQPETNGQLKAIVNGQLLAMVNGQLQALVNGQLMPIVNGQLLAMVNGQLKPIVNGQLMALVNGQLMALVNGQLMALVNGQLELATDFSILSNGQLQALVNGQLRPIVNGQLKAMVNGILTDIPNSSVNLVNGQLQAIVNGQLKALVNGQLRPIVNGQLQPIVNELEKVGELQLANGQLRAIVNGQLMPIVNGQLRAMVNGQLQPIVNADITLVNGQLRAIVNGQLQALVNGQLRAIVNGQLQPLVNGDAQPVANIELLTNGQLRAIVNGNDLPLANGQLQAIVNGQLLAMVNGQLMALVNGVPTFAVLVNGQLKALVNGQLKPLVNGQLQPIVNVDGTIANGQLMAVVNGQLKPLVNATLTNGQLQAIVNGESYSLANGQLRPLVNGQLRPIVNNFDVAGATNNANTASIIDGDDINVQGGALGGMFAVNTITGLEAGPQKLIPGAFVNENFDVTYGLGDVLITPRPLLISADSISKVYGDENPELTFTSSGFAYNDSEEDITLPTIVTDVNLGTAVGNYPINLRGGSAANYTLILQDGNFAITPKDLLITANNVTSVLGDIVPLFTYTATGFVNDQDASVFAQEPSLASNAVIGESPAGSYDIIPFGGSAPNYNLVYQNGSLLILAPRPSINCQPNITVNNIPLLCGAYVNFAVTETTPSPVSTITYSHASGSFFPVGTTIVTATVTNTSGSSVCTFTVTVIDNQAPVITCPADISVTLETAASQVNISAAIINNNVVISTSPIAPAPQSGLLSPQNDPLKTLSGSCNCPPGHALVGYEGLVGQIVDQVKLICAPINRDGSPGTPVVTTTCYNGGITGGQVGPFMAPEGSWMTGFRIGDVPYFGRAGTLTSIEGYSQSYTDVINGGANRVLNQQMAGAFIPELTTDQYAPPGTVLTGMNYYNGWEYSNTVQFKYQALVPGQELASFAVTDNCNENLTVNLTGNTTLTSANVGSNPLTVIVTDANGNQSTCTINVNVVDNTAPAITCDPVTIGAINCVSNIVLDGIQTVVLGGPSNVGNAQSDITYQGFVTGNQSSWLREIYVDMTRYPGYANSFMRATIYQGTLGDQIVGVLDIPNYNGGKIDFSTIDNGAPLQLLPNTMYTLLMVGTPGQFTNNYFWYFSNAVAGDPEGSVSSIGATLNMTVKLESCETNIAATAPYITGVGPEGQAITFSGNNYARDLTSRVPTSGPYTVSFWAKQTANQQGLAEMISQGNNLYIGHEPNIGYNGPQIGTVTSASRTGSSLTGITYNIEKSANAVVSKTTTAAEFIRSKLVLSTLTANPAPLDANRFWFTGKTSLTKDEALSVAGDLDMGTVFQECGSIGANHTALFDKKIYPGEGPEIFIVHGGLSGNFEILDENGNVALTVPYNAGSQVTVGGSVFTNNWTPAFYLRDNVNFQVEAQGSNHGNTQSGIIAIDIQPGQLKRISGIRFGQGPGATDCNYIYEILGVQPDVMPYEMRIGDFNNTNVAFPRDNGWHNYALVRDVTGNNTHLYLDGELVHSKGSLSPSPTGSVNGLVLGAQWNTSENFIGNIDEVKIYDYALSAAEVQCNQTRATTGTEQGLAGYYNFEEGSGTIAYNKTPSGGNMTIQNPTGTDWVRSIPVLGFFNDIVLDPTQYYPISGLPDDKILWLAHGYNNNQPFCTTTLTVQVPASCQAGRPAANRSSSQTTTTKTKVKPTQEVIAKESVYPNPATNTIKVQLGKEVTSANDINLVDAIGRLQTNISIRQLNNKLFELNISKLPKGVYIIRAKTLEGNKTFKFVKM